MSIFVLKDGRVQVDPVNLTIPEFREIYDRDLTKDKVTAFNELCYCYHMADYKSVYNNYDDGEKHTKILADYFKGGSFGPDQLILDAIEKYRSLQETPSMRLLKAARKALNKIIEYFNTVDLSERDGKGAIVNRIGDLTKSASDIGKIVESIDKLEEKIKKEQLRETKIRGQAEISDYERRSK